MIDVGDIIEIGGNQVTICYKTEYKNRKYICVAYEGEKLKYEIFEYKDDNNKLMVAKVDSPEEAAPVMEIFFKEGMKEYGVPDCFKRLFDKISEKKTED